VETSILLTMVEAGVAEEDFRNYFCRRSPVNGGLPKEIPQTAPLRASQSSSFTAFAILIQIWKLKITE
jgi:hypothetical protein